jgi:tRNA (mo5U34)-methyltransferase
MRLSRRIAGELSDLLRRAGDRARRVAPPRAAAPRTPEAQRLHDRVAAVPFWFHSLDLGQGVVTPGLKTAAVHQRELQGLQLPDLRGRSVLDIGAWDGFYSFAAERLGAARVVALDYHVWGLDRDAKQRYRAACRASGVPQRHPRHLPELWRFDTLPGKRGFDLAHAVLESRVEAVVRDVTTLDAAATGQFDVVLYLGVLYHMESPLDALARVRAVTRELAVIETEAVAIRGHGDRPLCEFFHPGRPLADDPTNFWVPNAAALVGLCEAAGFRRTEVLTPAPILRAGRVVRYRLVAHAFA